MRKFKLVVYRVSEVYSLELEKDSHEEACAEALRRVKQRLVKPEDTAYDLLALSADGAYLGVGTEASDRYRPRGR
jgi:hypothetical protein